MKNLHSYLYGDLSFNEVNPNLILIGKAAPKKIDADWDKQTIFLPFTSTSSGSKGIEHTHKSLVSSFYSPEGAANHWFDQYTGTVYLGHNSFKNPGEKTHQMKFLKNQIDFYFISQVLLVRTLSLLDNAPN